MESTRLLNAEHDLVKYKASRFKVPPSDSDDEPMEVNPLQKSSIADATVDTTDNGIHFQEVKGGTKRGGRKLFDNQGYSYVYLRTNGKC